MAQNPFACPPLTPDENYLRMAAAIAGRMGYVHPGDPLTPEVIYAAFVDLEEKKSMALSLNALFRRTIERLQSIHQINDAAYRKMIEDTLEETRKL